MISGARLKPSAVLDNHDGERCSTRR